jgi:uncharacterized protein YceK
MARCVAVMCTAALAMFALSGCGTIYNNAYSADLYGGVRSDAVQSKSIVADLKAHKISSSDFPLYAYFLLIDPPLCAIGDTLSLPYLLYERARMGY